MQSGKNKIIFSYSYLIDNILMKQQRNLCIDTRWCASTEEQMENTIYITSGSSDLLSCHWKWTKSMLYTYIAIYIYDIYKQT